MDLFGETSNNRLLVYKNMIDRRTIFESDRLAYSSLTFDLFIKIMTKKQSTIVLLQQPHHIQNKLGVRMRMIS